MPALWQDLGKKQPFASAAEQTFVNLVLTTSRLTRPVDQLFREHGLSNATYNILRILRGAGAEGRMCREVGRQLISHVPDVTRLLDGLERRGLVERRRSAEDRRVVYVLLTDEGAKLLETLDKPLLTLQEKLTRGLTLNQLQHINDLLDELRGGLEDPAAGAGGTSA